MPEKEMLADTPLAKLVVKKKSQRLNSWQNRLIEGDNLSVLKALYDDPSIKGKVRLVYIDPPFSTKRKFNGNNNELAYDDTMVGEDYLEFLRKRLIFLREILAKDGSIYVHIDWKMGHYVRVLMDEIFGSERFINDITRIKCNPKNFARPAYGNMKDTILFYSKGKKYVWNEAKEKLTEADIKRLFPLIDDDERRYTTTPLHAPGITVNGATGKEWKGLKPPEGRHWRYRPDELTRLDNDELIHWSSTGNPRLKIYADEARKRGKKRQDIWEFKDPAYPIYPTEKNLKMLKVIVDASSNPGDLVLDCFCGSGTTLIASQMLNRHWLGIDNSKMAIEECLKQLKKYNAPFTHYQAN